MFGDANPALASGEGLANLLASIRGLYPKAQITSGYRGPNHPLTQRNPRSMHAMGSQEDPRAVDVAPIPGVSFDQYVGSLKKAGVPVAQAFDEQKHPFPWTTGPNWHVAEGVAPRPPQGAAPKMPAPKQTLASLVQPQQQPPMPQQSPMTLGALMQPQQQAQPMPGPLQLPQGQSMDSFAAQQPEHKILGMKREQVAAMLAALADAANRYAGTPSNVLGGFQQGQEAEQAQQFDREKWAQQLEAQRQKALEPPEWLQDAQTFHDLPRDRQQTVLDYRNAMYPVVADFQNPDGSSARRAIPRQLPPEAGATEDGYTYMGGDPGDPSNWRKAS